MQNDFYCITDDINVYQACGLSKIKALRDAGVISDRTLVLDPHLYNPQTVEKILADNPNITVGSDVAELPPFLISKEEFAHKKSIVTSGGSILLEYLYKKTFCMVDMSGDTVFSGTLFEIDNRLILATAGHCVRDDETWASRCYLIPHNRPTVLSECPRILRAKRCEKGPMLDPVDGLYQKDVGLIEFDRETFDKSKYMDVLSSIEEISVRGSGEKNNICVDVGYPGTLARLTENSLRVAAVSYSTTPEPMEIELARFGNGFQYQRDDNIDIILSFPEKPDGADTAPFSTPIGMSGGGLWETDYKDAGLWSPDKARIIGIQSSWNSGNKNFFRHLRGVQIKHWLKLVYDEYPDLREKLGSIAGFNPSES